VNPSRPAPGAATPASPTAEDFHGLMSDLLAQGERLNVYDEPDDSAVASSSAPGPRDLESEPGVAPRQDSKAGRRAPVASGPFRLFGVFLGGMLTGGFFLALGFWAGRQARPAKVVPVHPSQANPSFPTKLNPLGSTASAEKPGARPDATTQVDHGTDTAKPDSALPPAASGQPASPKLDSGFNVQVASPATAQEAEDLVRILKNMGYPVLPTTSASSGPQRKPILVRVGPFPTREEAQQVVARLQLEGFKPSAPSGPGGKE